MATAAIPERAKKCKFFLNGDKTFTGKYLVLNRRRIRNWDSLLEEVTRGTKSNLPIRNICTPATGTQITTLDQFAEDGSYVAAPRRTFKKIDYLNLNDAAQNRRNNVPIKNFENIRPVEHSPLKVSAKARKARAGPTTLIVYINDQPFDGPFRITLPNHMIRNGWDVVMNEINERIQMSTCVQKLYSIDYKRITEIEQLESFSEYIAVGAGKQVVHLPYGSHRPKFNNSPKSRRRADSMPPILPKSRSRNQRLENSNSSTGSTSNKSTKSQPTGTTRNANQPPPRPRQKKQPKEEDEVFHAKPVKHKRSPEKSKETDYDKDEGGVFRAKSQREDTMDAKEIDDNKDTKVELPVDQREAEEINDEEEDLDKNNNDNEPKKTPTPPPTSRKTSRPPTTHRSTVSRKRPQSNHSSVTTSRRSTPESEKEDTARTEKEDTARTEKSEVKEQTPPASARSEKEQSEEQHDNKEEPPQENQPQEDNDEEREKAATKIQSTYRGHTTRKQMKKQQKAAVKIQSTYRGYGTRKNKKKEQTAATKIQSNYRGYQTRKQLKSGADNDTNGKDEATQDPPADEPDTEEK